MKRNRVIAALTGLGVFVLAVPAWAHVTVSAPGAARDGSDQQITFRVPVEKEIATTGVTVAIPTATPIAGIDVQPVPGWTHTETTTKLTTPIKTDDGDITSTVTQITWKATDGGLKPGEYGAFTILAGQLPDAASITFKALQTYADGSVVKWVEVAAPGSSDEPENPAPVLNLAAKASDGAAANTPTASTVTSSSKSASDTGPIILSVIALVLAAAAFGVAVVARARAGTARGRAAPAGTLAKAREGPPGRS